MYVGPPRVLDWGCLSPHRIDLGLFLGGGLFSNKSPKGFTIALYAPSIPLSTSTHQGFKLSQKTLARRGAKILSLATEVRNARFGATSQILGDSHGARPPTSCDAQNLRITCAAIAMAKTMTLETNEQNSAGELCLPDTRSM